jgi:SAM-dependent methyltransferase
MIVKDSHFRELKSTVINELVRIHHEKYLDDISFWLSMTKGRNPVLELGCGHGRVTLPLWKEGSQIVGVDLVMESLHYLLTASLNDKSPHPKLVLADMLSLPLKTKFGAVIIPCNTYSVFSREQRILLLNGINQLLTSTGIFLVSVPNPIVIQEYHRELSADRGELTSDVEGIFPHPSTGNPVQVSSVLSPLADALSWEWIYDQLHPDGRVERHRQTAVHQLSSLEQYQKEIEGTGFQSNHFLGDFDGSPYQDDSPYLIMVCSLS